MIYNTRTYKATVFTLYVSPTNSCFVFSRTDAGTETERTLLPDARNHKQAKEYYDSRVAFFCEVLGITLADMHQ